MVECPAAPCQIRSVEGEGFLMAVQQKSARAAIALALYHPQLAIFATASAAVAVLPAFTACLGGTLTVVGKIAA